MVGSSSSSKSRHSTSQSKDRKGDRSSSRGRDERGMDSKSSRREVQIPTRSKFEKEKGRGGGDKLVGSSSSARRSSRHVAKVKYASDVDDNDEDEDEDDDDEEVEGREEEEEEDEEGEEAFMEECRRVELEEKEKEE